MIADKEKHGNEIERFCDFVDPKGPAPRASRWEREVFCFDILRAPSRNFCVV